MESTAKTPLVTRSIHSIQEDYFSVIRELEENGGELTEELQERIQIAEADFEGKAEAYVKVISVLESDTDAIVKEVERLAKLSTSKTNTAKRLKETLLNALTLFGTKDKKGIWRYEKPTFKLSTRKSTSTEVKEGFNDERFITYTVKPKFSQEEINALQKLINAAKINMQDEIGQNNDTAPENPTEAFRILDIISNKLTPDNLTPSISKTDVKEFIENTLQAKETPIEDVGIFSVEELDGAYLNVKHNLTIK